MEVLSPTTLEEALSILWEKRGKAHVLSGGTDLVIKLKEDDKAPVSTRYNEN